MSPALHYVQENHDCVRIIHQIMSTPYSSCSEMTYPVFLTTNFKFCCTAKVTAACMSPTERTSTPMTGTLPCSHVPVMVVLR